MSFVSEQRKNLEISGFSLIEVLVALSIFAIVVTMAVGSLLVLIDANSKSQNTQQSINNVAFALDAMVRDIRTGYLYYCGNNLPDTGGNMFANTTTDRRRNCPSPGNGFVFSETGGSLTGSTGSRRVGFRHFVDASTGRGSIQRRIESGAWQEITAPEVNITTFNFIVTGATNNDEVSPLVTIFVEGLAGDRQGIDAQFSLQTTVTQQSLDL